MSAKGTSTFIIQRATAVILVPLGVWLLFSIVAHVGGDYAAARAWLAAPLNGVLFGGFVVIGAWHMRIGMAEIVIDYIHGWAKEVILFLNWIVALIVIGGAGYAIYNLSFAG